MGKALCGCKEEKSIAPARRQYDRSNCVEPSIAGGHTQCQRFLPGRNPRSLGRFLILWAGGIEPLAGRQLVGSDIGENIPLRIRLVFSRKSHKFLPWQRLSRQLLKPKLLLPAFPNPFSNRATVSPAMNSSA